MSEDHGRKRRYQGLMAWIVKIIAIILPLYSIFYIFDPTSNFGIIFFKGQYVSLFFCLFMVYLFLVIPMTKKSPRNRLPWYDVLFILVTLVGTLYIFFNYESIYTLDKVLANPFEQVLGLLTILVFAEAVRRTIGPAMLIISALFFFHALFAAYLPGLLGGPPVSLSRVIAYIYLYPQGIFGSTAEIAATIVVIFITFGAFLQEAGAGKWFVDLAMSLVGHLTGGPAKVAILSSALFGTISGSPMANAGTCGPVTIPLMIKNGYKPYFAGAVEGVASTGGIIMPPVMGAVAFLMAYYTGAGYSAVCVAAAIPAVLYFIALYCQVDLEARKNKLVGLPRQQLPSFIKTLKEGWPFLIPLVLLVVMMMVFGYNASKACAYTLAVLVIVCAFKRDTRMGPQKIFRALESGTEGMLPVAGIMSLIGIVTGSLAITGLGVNLSILLINLAGNSLLLLAVLAGVACYILGMGISATLNYILVAILVAPAMIQLGMPKMAAHMFVLYMSCSTYITPPNAGTIFVTAGIAGSSVFKTGFKAMQLGACTYLVPFMLVFRPAIAFIGNIATIAMDSLIALVVVGVLAFGFEGYLFKNMSWWLRITLIAAGVAILIPNWWTFIIGIAVVLTVVFWQWRSSRSVRLSSEGL